MKPQWSMGNCGEEGGGAGHNFASCVSAYSFYSLLAKGSSEYG